MKVVIAGGSGFIGQAVATHLVARGDEVVVLSRHGTSGGHGRTVSWDGRTVGDWAHELDGADAVVNVTGASIGVRSTRRNVDRLIASRVEPAVALGGAIAACRAAPPLWVQVSAVGIFGDAGDALLDERATPSGIGPRGLVTVCLAWEHAFATASALVERAVLLRLGAVLGRGDPLTTALAPLVRRGMGGRAGSGRQWLSWVTIDDVVAAITLAIDDHGMRGLYHVASPEPVTNREMMATLRRLLGVRFGPPAPAPLVRIGAYLQGATASLVLPSQRAVPRRLLDAGFTFATSSFETAARRALADAGYEPR